MENRFRLGELKKENLICSIILVITLMIVAGGFLFSDFYNASKSYLAADFYRTHIWPWFSGWNPHGYGGYPMGYFRPCLMEWLAGGLGKLIGAQLALKLLGCLSLAALPFAVRLFLLDQEFSSSAIFISLFLSLTSLALFSNAASLDYTIIGSFGFGRVTSFWALPFVFLYLWAFRRGVRDFTYLCLASVFFSVVILSHDSTAKSLLIMSLAAGYYFFFRKNRHKIPDYFIHILLVLVLSLVWLGPFFIERESYWSGTLAGHGLFEFISGRGIFLLVIVGTCFKAAARYKKSWPAPLVFIIFLLSCLLGAYFLSAFISWLPGPQFLPLIFVFGSFVAGYYLNSFGKRRVILFSTGAVFCAATSFAAFSAMHLRNRKILNLHEGAHFTRGMVDDNPDSYFHTDLNAPLLITSTYLSHGADILNGEEPESSTAAPFIYGFLKELDEDADTQGVTAFPPHPARAYAHALILGPQWILTNELLKKSAVSFVAGKKVEPYVMVNGSAPTKLDYTLYLLPNGPVMFLPKAPVAYSKSEWNKAVGEWWEHKDLGVIPILADQAPGVDTPPSSRETVSLAMVSTDSYILKIGSPQPRWIFIKIPYFPDWGAYQNDQPLPLYRAGPNMMAVFAKGEVDLFFERKSTEKLFHYLSLGAWIFTLFFVTFSILGSGEKRTSTN